MKMLRIDEVKDLWPQVRDASSILLHCHPNPDGDSLGSALALYLALKNGGKKVALIQGDSPAPKYLSFLPGFNDIEQHSFFDIDQHQFDLFIILDSGSLNQISKLQPIVFPAALQTIVIDHHVSNTGFGTYNVIDPTFSSTAEMVYYVLRDWSLSLTKDIALCLLTGIYTDTGGFSYGSILPRTFTALAELVYHAPNYTEAIFKLQNSNTAGRLAFKGAMLSSVELFAKGKVAIAALSAEKLASLHINDEDTESGSIANELKSVVGWEVSVCAVETTLNNVKLSFRTRNSDKYDLSKVAVALGGGGHKAAAGATLALSLSEALEKVKQTIGEVYPDLKN